MVKGSISTVVRPHRNGGHRRGTGGETPDTVDPSVPVVPVVVRVVDDPARRVTELTDASKGIDDPKGLFSEGEH